MAQNEVNIVRVLGFHSESYSSVFEKRCFCCLANNIPMIQLATCKHNEFLLDYIKKNFNFLVVCRMCHIMLVKIYYFSQQVTESSSILYGKSTEVQISNRVYNLEISHKVVTTTNISDAITPKLTDEKVPENKENTLRNTIEKSNVQERVGIKEEKRIDIMEEHVMKKEPNIEMEVERNDLIHESIDMIKEHDVKNEQNVGMEVERNDMSYESIDIKQKSNKDTDEKSHIDLVKEILSIAEEVDLDMKEDYLDIKEDSRDITETLNVDLVEKTSDVKIEIISDSDSSHLENSDSETDSIENLTDIETNHEVKALDKDLLTCSTIDKHKNFNIKQMVVTKNTRPPRTSKLPKKYIQLPQNNELQSKNNKLPQKNNKLTQKNKQLTQKNKQLTQKNKQLPRKNKLAQKNNESSLLINNEMPQETNQLPNKKRKRRKNTHIATLPKKKQKKQITQIVEDTEKKHKSKFKVIMLSKEQIVEEREQKLNNKYFLMHDYKCESCIIAFRNEILLQEHNKEMHMTGSEQCVICKVKMNAESYANHLLVAHMRRYECVICGERSTTIKKISQHFNNFHSDILETIDSTIKCRLCDFTTESQSCFHTHIEEHKNKGIYSCAICNKNMTTQNSLSRHMQGAHNITLPVIFKCELCKENFRKKASLFQHMFLVHPDKKSPMNYCRACNSHFGEPDSLTHHYKTHPHHENSFECKECSLSFTDENRLNLHINFHHSNSGDYQCTTCLEVFRRAAVLKKHILNCNRQSDAASSIPKWVGKFCNQFSTSETLKDHCYAKASSKQFESLHCNATYASPKNLDDHIRLKHKQSSSQAFTIPTYVILKQGLRIPDSQDKSETLEVVEES